MFSWQVIKVRVDRSWIKARFTPGAAEVKVRQGLLTVTAGLGQMACQATLVTSFQFIVE